MTTPTFFRRDDLMKTINPEDHIIIATDLKQNKKSVNFRAFDFKNESAFEALLYLLKFDNHFYEVIPPTIPIKPFFDLEIDFDLDCHKENALKFIHVFIGYISTHFNIELVLNDFSIFDSCREKKLSYHIIIQNKIYFKNMADHKLFFSQFFEYLFQNNPEWTWGEKKDKTIADKCVYGNFQNFRCVNQSKKGKGFVLKNVGNVELKDSFIGLYFGTDDKTALDIVPVAKPVITKVLGSPESENIDINRNWVCAVLKNHILDELIMDYNKWLSVGYMFADLTNDIRYFEAFSKNDLKDRSHEYEDTWKCIVKNNERKKNTLKDFQKIIKKTNPDGYNKVVDHIIQITKEANKKRIVVENEMEAGDAIYKEIENKLIFCGGTYYYKYGDIWTNKEADIKKKLFNFINHFPIFEVKWEGEDLIYKQFATKASVAKNVCEIVMSNALVNPQEDFKDKFHLTTKKKICFKNGILNIETKKFTKWEDNKGADEVFSCVIINRDYNPVRNEETIKKVYNDIYKNIFDEECDIALQCLSRGISGHIEDKAWCAFRGNRNCGKGVIQTNISSTFGDYIGTINSENFLVERIRNSGDSAKKLAWLLDSEFKRIDFTQEILCDVNDKTLKINGVAVKAFASGGDTMVARKNFQDQQTFTIDSRLWICCNDLPPISTPDALETCVSFTTTKQFISQEFLDERIADQASPLELKTYRLANPLIKDWCKTEECIDATIHLICDYYLNKAVPFNNKNEVEGVVNIKALILKSFSINFEKNNKGKPIYKVTHQELRDWIKKNELNISCNKLVTELIGFGCSNDRSKKRLTGVFLIEKEEVEEEED